MIAFYKRSLRRVAGAEKVLGRSHRLSGTVLDPKGQPSNRQKVQVFEQAGGLGGHLKAKATILTNELGQWDVEFLSETTYMVIAYDKSGQFDPAAKSGLIPEPME